MSFGGPDTFLHDEGSGENGLKDKSYVTPHLFCILHMGLRSRSFLTRFMCGCSTCIRAAHAVFEKDWHRLLFGKGDGVSFLCLPSEIYLTYANPLY